VQMQKAMDNVQLEFARERVGEHASVPFSGLDADKNFTVLKCQHVGRTRFAEKLAMQPRHPAIGNEENKNLFQPHQFRAFLAPNLYAKAYGFCGELLELGEVHRHFSLKAPYADPRGAHFPI
jgi:hypothetical protein